MVGWFGKKKRRSPSRTPSRTTKSQPPSRGVFFAALGALLVSIIASVFLVLGHIRAMDIPGCGIGSPCAEAAASAWGKLPGVEWPVSFIGLAYFFAAAVGWSIGKGVVPSAYSWMVRIGAAVSLLYVVVIIGGGHWCMYCLTAHAGNFAFFWIVERGATATRELVSTLVPTGSAFVACSLVLAVVQLQRRESIHAEADRQISETTKQILESTTQRVTSSQPHIGSPSQRDQDKPDAPPSGFTGRYHRGPETASIRVVAFTDYQCPICKQFEATVERMLDRHSDVRVSFKQFPECEDCNPHFKRKNLHPNACRAAYAAEAAGILGGKKAFWKMHDWLFQKGGEFSYEELAEAARRFGLEDSKLLQAMDSPRVRARIDADIAEAVSLGIPHTPMAFVNGVELRGMSRRDALLAAVETLATKDLPRLSPEADRPRLASDRYLELWQAAPEKKLPKAGEGWPLGADNAPVRIVMWGDFQDAETVQVDAAIRKLQKDRNNIRYDFRSYPLNTSCNPTVARSDNLMACLTAQAAKAAGILDGRDGYWHLHDWLMSNRDGMYEEGLMAGAKQLGMDPGKLAQAMRDERVARAISDDASGAVTMKLKTLPMLFVNEKQVPRFYGEDLEILGKIVESAATSKR